MKSYISLTNYLQIEVISMSYYKAMKVTAGEPPKQKLAEQIHQNACHMGILPVTFPRQIFFKVLAHFLFLPPILSSPFPPSLHPTLPPFLSADIILSLSFPPFLPPSFPLPLTSLSPPPARPPSPHAIVETIFYCRPPDTLRLQVPCMANFHPLLDSSREDGVSLLSST